MKITKSPEKTAEVLDMIRDSFGAEIRAGTHLSDLLYPRRAYWTKVKPLPATDTDIQYWLAGRGHENAFHRITGLKHVGEREWNGIKYGLDFLWEHPVEMKTRRRYLAEAGKEADVYREYLRQLIGYCAVENDPMGRLFVWSLVEKTGVYQTAPAFVVYEVEWTDEELVHERARLSATKVLLECAIRNEVPLVQLPQCPPWMCGKTIDEISVYPRCLDCNRDFKTEQGIVKHINSDTGRGHTVRKTTYRKAFTPTCRWYEDCRPKIS